MTVNVGQCFLNYGIDNGLDLARQVRTVQRFREELHVDARFARLPIGNELLKRGSQAGFIQQARTQPTGNVVKGMTQIADDRLGECERVASVHRQGGAAFDAAKGQRQAGQELADVIVQIAS